MKQYYLRFRILSHHHREKIQVSVKDCKQSKWLPDRQVKIVNLIMKKNS
jgi:hypothetical protein